MGIRAEQKEKTRSALLQAVLDMAEEGRSFSSISLREVTRAVGVVPTAFYRHFKDMDELGLAIVESVLPAMRAEMRDIRDHGRSADAMFKEIVDYFISFVLAHPREFAFYAREITGGCVPVREQLRMQTFIFTLEMANDFPRMNLASNISQEDRVMIADMVVRIMLTLISDILLTADKPSAQAAIRQRFLNQVRLIGLGTLHWSSRSAPSLY